MLNSSYSVLKQVSFKKKNVFNTTSKLKITLLFSMLLTLIILLLRGTAEAREIESLVRFFEKIKII